MQDGPGVFVADNIGACADLFHYRCCLPNYQAPRDHVPDWGDVPTLTLDSLRISELRAYL